MKKNQEEEEAEEYDLKRLGAVIAASSFSSLVSRVWVHPIDSLRANAMVGTSPFKRSLFAGLRVSLFFAVPGTAAFLTTYDVLDRFVLPCHVERGNRHLLAAFGAETISGLFWTPMEVVKQLQQVGRIDQQASLHRALLQAHRRGGLMKGYFVNLGVYAPYSILFFSFYETFAGRYDSSIPFSHRIATSVTAAATAALITSPLDVVKTRIQTSNSESYANFQSAVRTIFREFGLRGFLRGSVFRMLWAAGNTGIVVGTFDSFLEFLLDDD